MRELALSLTVYIPQEAGPVPHLGSRIELALVVEVSSELALKA